MTIQFAQAVDPIFLHVLDLLDRISRGESPNPQEERMRLNALIDQAGAMLGGSPEWELAKYALASWIDEVLLETPWEGVDWWNNNVLEVELFNTRLCNELFYRRAQEAANLPRRDALEVFYVCVVLGFRGLYRDGALAALLTQALNLAPDLETWARQTALAIRLGQGRPALPAPARELRGAAPLKMKPLVAWAWLSAIFLLAATVMCVVL
ncbi:MAG TPA: DotU family type IV/VI secretion system protein [Pirellulales bacterium]|nr:DotU family type IV/VI secretion system protein [Pirellulales bacterium]